MISLSDLKQFVCLKKSDLSNLEYNLMHWLENRTHDDVELSDKDIIIGLRDYLDEETIFFWAKYLNDNTKRLFFDSYQSNCLEKIYELKLNEMDIVSGTLFLKEGSLSLNSPLFAEIIKKLNLNMELSNSLVQIIEASDTESVNEFSITIEYNENKIVISENGLKSEVEKYFLNTVQIIKAATTISMMVASVNGYSADKNEVMEAIQQSGKAIVQVEAVKTIIEENRVKIEQTSKRIQEENPNARIPATIVAYGAKIVNDGGIKIKSSTDLMDHKVNYQLLVGPETSIVLSGKNPLQDSGSNYELTGTAKKVQFNMKWDINW